MRGRPDAIRAMKGGLGITLLVGGFAALGPAVSAGAHAPPRTNPGGDVVLGRLVGGIVYRGRAPSGSANRYQRGLVRIYEYGHEVAHQRVERNRRYHFKLLVGTRYTIVAHVRWGNCTAHTMVRRSTTTHTNTYCVFH